MNLGLDCVYNSPWVALGEARALEGELCGYDWLVCEAWRVPGDSIIASKVS
jgi:hypothetical protein